LLSGVVLLPGARPSAAASGEASADTLRQLEAEFMKAAADHGSQGYMSYYAEDAVEVPNGEPIIRGKVNIAKTMGFLDDKNNHLTWSPMAPTWHQRAIWAIPTELTSSVQSGKMGSPLSNTVSTRASGRNRGMEAGKSFSIWATRARTRHARGKLFTARREENPANGGKK